VQHTRIKTAIAMVMTLMIIVLLFSACSSKQSSDVIHPDSYNAQNNSIVRANTISSNTVDRQNAQRVKVRVTPIHVTPSVPVDGRLRDADITVYVSVKIKQEQFHYEWAITQTINQELNTLYAQSDSDINFETLAINYFEFDPQLYHWSKKTINTTLSHVSDPEFSNREEMSNFNQWVISHNISMIEKFKDELRFAKNYKLNPTFITKPKSILKAINTKEMALFLIPST
jgi:hypothetical protein